MSKVKKILIIFIAAVIVGAGIFTYFYMQNWTWRFKSELDNFFGEGNWECLSSQTNESKMYSVYRRSSTGYGSEETPGTYHEWSIAFENRDSQTEVWDISDHTMKINHDKNWLLSSKRYSAKQALTLELMDLSFSAAADEICKDVLGDILSENQIKSISVYISYRGGNPEPSMYDKLIKESWFTANTVTAYDYLSSDLHDFYIRIQGYDYKMEKLSEEEYTDLLGSLGEIEDKLKQTYGEYADYEIYLTDGYECEYNAQDK